MDKYKENNIRLTKMLIPEWVQTINKLKNLECNNDNKYYVVSYKKENQRKNRKFIFHDVKYLDETYSFVFTQFKTTFMGNELTDEALSIEVLIDIEIDSLEITESLEVQLEKFYKISR